MLTTFLILKFYFNIILISYYYEKLSLVKNKHNS